jgi:hypothetical protein
VQYHWWHHDFADSVAVGAVDVVVAAVVDELQLMIVAAVDATTVVELSKLKSVMLSIFSKSHNSGTNLLRRSTAAHRSPLSIEWIVVGNRPDRACLCWH